MKNFTSSLLQQTILDIEWVPLPPPDPLLYVCNAFSVLGKLCVLENLQAYLIQRE